MKSLRPACFAGASLLFLLSPVSAQYPGFGGGGGGPPGFGNPGGPGGYNPNGQNGNPSSSNPATTGSAAQYLASSAGQNINHVLAAHAVMACLAWLLFVPTGGIILRLGINSPWVVRVHAICQVLAYGVYIIAAAMGFWLARQFSQFENIWSQPHPILGVVILIVALVQPISGYIHHQRYKRKVSELRHGEARPGRSGLSRFHLFIGRSLMILAVVNGGLGLRGAAPLQSATTTKNAKVIYAVLSGWMAILYIGIVTSFELRKATQEKKGSNGVAEPKFNQPPSYDESQESLARNGSYDDSDETRGRRH